jgi:hypothetical protein
MRATFALAPLVKVVASAATVALASLAAPAWPGEIPADMLLICQGQTSGHRAVGTTTATIFDNQGNQVTGNAVSTAPGDVIAVVQFRVRAGQAEMNVPAALTPMFAGGKNGWFKVKKLAFTDDTITGKVAFTFLDNTSFEIDRRTGILTAQGFQALCERAELSERRF